MDRWWRLLAGARVARFATLAPGGAPSLVPVCFVVERETIYHAVDHKPKATRALARLEHLRADPRAALLADRYDDEDWSRLWWVRADGRARVVDDAPHAIDLLVEKYPQYREHRPEGPVVALDVERMSGWSAG
ncbi:MAG: putative pyridoxamine 5-phosphate oxidase-related protein [Conexibacter sp.]|nr:putative pyridoxamine 5-phosphate oxidase-related protein [Conexibacter sp.]